MDMFSIIKIILLKADLLNKILNIIQNYRTLEQLLTSAGHSLFHINLRTFKNNFRCYQPKQKLHADDKNNND